jgi:hypothetical protein
MFKGTKGSLSAIYQPPDINMYNLRKERFYDIRHAQQVASFDDHCAIKPNDNHPGHWVSKAWIKGK